MNNWLFGFAFGVAVTAAALSGLRYWAEKVSEDDWGNCPTTVEQIAVDTGTEPARWEIIDEDPTVRYIYSKDDDEPEKLTFSPDKEYFGLILGHFAWAPSTYTNVDFGEELTNPTIMQSITWVCISR